MTHNIIFYFIRYIMNMSTREIITFNMNDLKQQIKCYDFSGTHVHDISYKIKNDIMSHDLFAICLKKMYNSINTDFIKSEQKFIKYKNDSISLQRHKQYIKGLFQRISRQKYYQKNSINIKNKCNFINKWYKYHRFRKILCKTGSILKNIYAYKIQTFYRKNTKYPPLFDRNNYFFNNEFVLDGENKYEITRYHLLIKEQYKLIEIKEKEIKEFNLLKNKNSYKLFIKKLNIIKQILKDGIENKPLLINDINLYSDSIKLIDNKLQLTSGYIIVYTFLDKIKEYTEYSKIINNCSILIDNINKFIDNDYTTRQINYDDPIQMINELIQPTSIFREYSIPVQDNQISRLVSNSMYNTPEMQLLRQVSCY